MHLLLLFSSCPVLRFLNKAGIVSHQAVTDAEFNPACRAGSPLTFYQSILGKKAICEATQAAGYILQHTGGHPIADPFS
jgi:hypothetical protein